VGQSSHPAGPGSGVEAHGANIYCSHTRRLGGCLNDTEGEAQDKEIAIAWFSPARRCIVVELDIESLDFLQRRDSEYEAGDVTLVFSNQRLQTGTSGCVDAVWNFCDPDRLVIG
jgi:hypothetical protein